MIPWRLIISGIYRSSQQIETSREESPSRGAEVLRPRLFPLYNVALELPGAAFPSSSNCEYLLVGLKLPV